MEGKRLLEKYGSWTGWGNDFVQVSFGEEGCDDYVERVVMIMLRKKRFWVLNWRKQ